MVGQCKVGVGRVECRVDQSKIGFSNGVEVGRRLSREGCAEGVRLANRWPAGTAALLTRPRSCAARASSAAPYNPRHYFAPPTCLDDT